MNLKKELHKALLAHTAWKSRLRAYIEGDDIGFDIEKAGTDSNCAFGKWLYGDTITEAEKQSDYYKEVKNLHSEFHKSVKKVIDLVKAGEKEEAGKMLLITGEYCEISSRLVLSLAEWENLIK